MSYGRLLEQATLDLALMFICFAEATALLQQASSDTAAAATTARERSEQRLSDAVTPDAARADLRGRALRLAPSTLDGVR